MINEHQSISEALKESSRRIDGKAMLLACSLSILSAVVWLVLVGLHIKSTNELWKSLLGLFVIPIVIFVAYIRLRQFDTTSSVSSQIINSIIILVSGIAFIYTIFSK